MSRTYRRKCHGYGTNKRNYDEWVVSDWVREEKPRWKWTRKALEGQELQKAIKVFHSDNHKWMGSAPSWFVREFCNKPYRAKAKAEIRRMLQSGEYDDYNFNPHKRNAMWMWW